MIVTAAVCPPAPFLIPGLADRLAAGAADLEAACQQALSRWADVDGVVILSVARPGEASSVLMPGATVAAAGLARSDRAVVAPLRLPSATAGPSAPAEQDMATVGTTVAAHLLANARITVPTRALQVDSGAGTQLLDGARTALPEDGRTRLPGDRRTGLLVMADGAACHGEHAPGGQDPRSEEFDRDIVTALRSGDPSALAATCRRLSGLAPDLRADSLPALAAMAELTTANAMASAEVLHYSAPYGVGYAVAVWQWD